MRDHFKHVGAVDYALLRSSDEMSRAEDGAAIPAQRGRLPPPGTKPGRTKEAAHGLT